MPTLRLKLDRLFTVYQYVIARVLPIIIAASLGVMGILVLDRREPLTVGDVTIIPAPVHAGERAYAVFQATELRVCDGTVHRWIEDSSGHIFTFAPEPTEYPALLAKTSRQFVKEFVVPNGMIPGPAVYHSDVERWCNSLQWALWRFHYSYQSSFAVIRKK